MHAARPLESHASSRASTPTFARHCTHRCSCRRRIRPRSRRAILPPAYTASTRTGDARMPRRCAPFPVPTCSRSSPRDSSHAVRCWWSRATSRSPRCARWPSRASAAGPVRRRPPPSLRRRQPAPPPRFCSCIGRGSVQSNLLVGNLALGAADPDAVCGDPRQPDHWRWYRCATVHGAARTEELDLRCVLAHQPPARYRHVRGQCRSAHRGHRFRIG